MTWTQYDCPCGEVFGANGWRDGRTIAEAMWLDHLETVHPEWVVYDITAPENDDPLQDAGDR